MLLIALRNLVPVGDIYLWLEPAEEPEIRERLPGIPLLTHLEVLPQWRDRGIGTALMTEAEQFVRDRGHDRIALGLRPDNGDAARLYARLGYVEWDYPPVATSDEIFLDSGRRIRVLETCRVLVKSLVAD